MSQKELQTLIAKNTLLSRGQKLVLFDKLNTVSDEQGAQLVAIFQKYQEKRKPLVIKKLKAINDRKSMLESLFAAAHKQVLRQRDDLSHEDDTSLADKALNKQIAAMTPIQPRNKDTFIMRCINFIKKIFSKSK